MSINIQGDRETCYPASRSRTDKSRNTVTRNWVLHCYAPGIWRRAEKEKMNSRVIQLHVTGSSHSTEPNCHVLNSKQWAPFRTSMRLVGALKQDLTASAHTERLLPCSSANLISFCWLLFHVWPDSNSFQIFCFFCFCIKFYLHTCYSYKPTALLFSQVQDLASWLNNC